MDSKKLKSNLLLEGQESERLNFGRFETSHFNDWLPFFKDPRSTKYWEGLPSDPVKACQQQFERIFERYNYNLGGMNALFNKNNGELIGMCGLLVQQVDDIRELEIGYSVLPKFWDLGYATEAAAKCKAYAFENELTDSLISIIHINNTPSQKVALKIGMANDKTTTYKDNPVHIFRVYPE